MTGLLTADQVKDVLGVRNVTTVYRWASAGKLPRIVLGPRSIRFRPEDVEAFIAKQRQTAKSSDAPDR